MVEWGRLLSGYWGEILSRRFESCPPRHSQDASYTGAFLFHRRPLLKGCYSNPVLPATIKTRPVRARFLFRRIRMNVEG